MNTIIFNSEIEFRNYLIDHSDNIINVMLLEDRLDNVIYFYSFTNDSLIIAAKESSIKNYDYYNKKYRKLVKLLNLDLEYTNNNPKVLKFTKKTP